MSFLAAGDVVKLDGRFVNWERLNVDETGRALTNPASFVYIKYWKPRGVECTTDRRQRRNIIDALGALPGVSDRIFPVGRLDVDSTGLILLTNDGTMVNKLLRASEQKQKEYLVSTDRRATDAQVRQLASGVVITTVAQRDGRSKSLTAPTLPCVVERPLASHTLSHLRAPDPNLLRFVLQEGRNRQIRRMCEEVGLSVVKLHRVGFAGVRLNGCERPGAWQFLTDSEVNTLLRVQSNARRDSIDSAPAASVSIGTKMRSRINGRQPPPQHRQERAQQQPRRQSGQSRQPPRGR